MTTDLAQNQEQSKKPKKLSPEELLDQLTLKQQRWLEAYFNKDSPTFGNSTKSAIYAYELDPKKQYYVAAQIGHENMKKHKNLGKIYLESKGLTYFKMLDIASKRMLTQDKSTAWFDRVMKHGDWVDPKITDMNPQNNFTLINVTSAETVNYNQKFLEFMNETPLEDLQSSNDTH